ncbi:hypothetical protein O1D97_10515 [Marinomonas sp. 15G1-11]|uniref:Uncharacterized protein n=1 Tax=Marinomonas phaeophyticola TaxID=3004091 RepID=A0ABT4JV00_9GAMM|nr:hypothetical protein [Marinomonas sp. 15G1-11]MCZ2722071.1 hypothetical protein [Marinomonas sp. 15G1-11]
MTYHNNQRGDSHEGNESGGRFQIAMSRACKRAATAPKLSSQLNTACINVVDIWMGLFPAVMGIGTTALIINEFTPVFQIVSYSFIFILDLLQIPEAKAAAPAMIVGFIVRDI